MPPTIRLPMASAPGQLPRLLRRRRSTKSFTTDELALARVSDALWSALGTIDAGRRVVPSARTTYPVTGTLIAGTVTDLPAGAYRYEPERHTLEAVEPGDHRSAVAQATLDAHDWLPDCPALLLLTADPRNVRESFPDQDGDHAERFMWIEVGHISQNLYLWAADNDLGAVLIAGIDDTRAHTVCRALSPVDHQLLAVMGLGHPAQPQAGEERQLRATVFRAGNSLPGDRPSRVT